MFSSRNRHHYQVIDDDYNESDARSSGGQNLLPFTQSRSYYSTTESARLIPESSGSYRQEPERDDLAEPLIMASSSEEANRFDHVNDLDDFFRRVYDYHQGGGFQCLFWASLWTLFQFAFIVFISTFFLQCIDYDILFNNKALNASDPLIRKRHFGDAIVQDCSSHLHPFIVLCLLIAIVYWIFLVIRSAVYLLKLREIQNFYLNVLHISDEDLPNMTWDHIVQTVVCSAGRVQLSVHDSPVSSIHLYHRILRFKNYMLAMVNQDLLPPLVSLPLVGEFRYMPDQLKLNLEWLYFLGFCSPFKGSYTLQEEYKDARQLETLADRMEKTVTYLGLVNLILSPLIFIYQCFYYIFTAADLTKRDTGALGNRAYTNYGRYRVRHFNELDHELKGRLNRSYPFASAYVAQFNSPLVVVFARNISFVAAAIFAPLTVLSVWDEDVLQIEHVLTVLTVCGVVAVVCRSLIPDDNLIYQPEILLTHVTSELHYVPDHWKEKAHDLRVLHEFESLFRLRALNLLEEISSPLITPFILLFYIRPSSRATLSFISENTVRVEGLGDVCSFALLDVALHGDPVWQKMDEGQVEEGIKPSGETAHDGKTEMSCIQFAIRHPDWPPPPASAAFLNKFRSRMERDALKMGAAGTMGRNVLSDSIHTLLSMPVNTPLTGIPLGVTAVTGTLREQSESRLTNNLERSLRQSGHESVVESLNRQPGSEMKVSALYLRGLRGEQRKKVYASMGPADQSLFAVPMNETVNSDRPSTVEESDERREEEEEDRPPMHFPV